MKKIVKQFYLKKVEELNFTELYNIFFMTCLGIYLKKEVYIKEEQELLSLLEKLRDCCTFHNNLQNKFTVIEFINETPKGKWLIDNIPTVDIEKFIQRMKEKPTFDQKEMELEARIVTEKTLASKGIFIRKELK